MPISPTSAEDVTVVVESKEIKELKLELEETKLKAQEAELKLKSRLHDEQLRYQCLCCQETTGLEMVSLCVSQHLVCFPCFQRLVNTQILDTIRNLLPRIKRTMHYEELTKMHEIGGELDLQLGDLPVKCPQCRSDTWFRAISVPASHVYEALFLVNPLSLLLSLSLSLFLLTCI